MEAVYTKSGSHDNKMEDGSEVLITSPSSKLLPPTTNVRRSRRSSRCSVCLGPGHENPCAER